MAAPSNDNLLYAISSIRHLANDSGSTEREIIEFAYQHLPTRGKKTTVGTALRKVLRVGVKIGVLAKIAGRYVNNHLADRMLDQSENDYDFGQGSSQQIEIIDLTGDDDEEVDDTAESASVFETDYGEDTEVESEAGTEATSEADMEAYMEAYWETETEVGSEADTEVATEAETDVASEAETEVVSEAETETETEAASEVETEVASEAETEVVSKAGTDVHSDARTNIFSDTEKEVGSKARTEGVSGEDMEEASETGTEVASKAGKKVYTDGGMEVDEDGDDEGSVDERTVTKVAKRKRRRSMLSSSGSSTSSTGSVFRRISEILSTVSVNKRAKLPRKCSRVTTTPVTSENLNLVSVSGQECCKNTNHRFSKHALGALQEAMSTPINHRNVAPHSSTGLDEGNFTIPGCSKYRDKRIGGDIRGEDKKSSGVKLDKTLKLALQKALHKIDKGVVAMEGTASSSIEWPYRIRSVGYGGGEVQDAQDYEEDNGEAGMSQGEESYVKKNDFEFYF